MPKVFNKKIDTDIPDDAVYIGRPSDFGNPYVMIDESWRDRVCDQFENYCENNPDFVDYIKDRLKGRDLVCFCAPKRCHGDTLLRIANEE